MRLVKGCHIVEDRFVRVLDEAPIPEGVPVLIPGIKSPVKIGTTADTVLEDGELTDRQDTTPAKNKYGVDGNWN